MYQGLESCPVRRLVFLIKGAGEWCILPDVAQGNVIEALGQQGVYPPLRNRPSDAQWRSAEAQTSALWMLTSN